METLPERKMAKQKFTVFLIPDTGGYQAIVPHYSEAISYGDSPEEAFANAKEALALLLEDETEPVPPNVHASHTIVGDIELDIPEALLTEVRLFSESRQASPMLGGLR